MKEGNIKKFKGDATLGLISSKLTLEGPLIKNKSSFIVSGRRTYRFTNETIYKMEKMRLIISTCIFMT